MNTLMWEHPVTARHIEQITADLRDSLRVVMPVSKKLACDDVGLGAMAEREAIVAELARLPDAPATALLRSAAAGILETLEANHGDRS